MVLMPIQQPWLDLQPAIALWSVIKHKKVPMWNALDMHIWTSMLSITNNKPFIDFVLSNTAILLMNVDANLWLPTSDSNVVQIIFCY
jgi:hypothetical protein